jgi:hypothetical protein
MDTENNNRFLIIARVGDNSLHREWIKPVEFKNFDLCISYYGNFPGLYENECDFYYESKGPKWPKIKEVIEMMGEKIRDYDAIWLPDDDILTDAKNINEMFTVFLEQGFELAQPALTSDSYYSHNVTVQHPDYLWRYSKFVEIMAPIFSKYALEQCVATFNLCQSGWGLDLLWPKILCYPYKKIAFIDSTPVKHTRPIGSGTLYNGLTPHSELHWIENHYDVSLACASDPHYDGVLRPRKMFVMVLAHENEHVLEAQIANIRFFNPDVGIIVYNGGENKEFAKNLRVPICPTSSRVYWTVSARVLWDVMKWLQEMKVDYEYLISFDHDMLFVRPGFEGFLDESMKDLDCMGWQLLKGTEMDYFPDRRVAETLWREWKIWQPIFQMDNFLRVFNPGQVYRKGIIEKMITFLESKIDKKELDYLFNNTLILGFEEMFSVTLALASGGRCGEYPEGKQYNNAVRWGHDISFNELHQVINESNYYWIHPIKYNNLIEMHNKLINDN